MRLDTQEYLQLVESTNNLLFLDIEASNLRGDYGSVLCVSIKPYKKRPYSFFVSRPGSDKGVIRSVKAVLEESHKCWVTYFGKGFDIPFLNTRCLKHGIPPIEPRPHIDLYYTIKHNTVTSRRSQGHILSWLGTPQQKMSVSADVWNQIVGNPKKHMPEMIARCESDVRGLEALYDKTKHIIKEIKR